MNEIKMLKNIMEDIDMEELDQLYNEIDSLKADCPEAELTKKVEEFLLAPEAELAIQIYFNKEEYENFMNGPIKKDTAIEFLKESFYGV